MIGIRVQFFYLSYEIFCLIFTFYRSGVTYEQGIFEFFLGPARAFKGFIVIQCFIPAYFISFFKPRVQVYDFSSGRLETFKYLSVAEQLFFFDPVSFVHFLNIYFLCISKNKYLWYLLLIFFYNYSSMVMYSQYINHFGLLFFYQIEKF